jgi:hypothetical protein
LHSGWKPNGKKRKTGNSESTPFPVSLKVTRTGFEQVYSILLFSGDLRKQAILRNLRSHNLERFQSISSNFSPKQVVNPGTLPQKYQAAAPDNWSTSGAAFWCSYITI